MCVSLSLSALSPRRTPFSGEHHSDVLPTSAPCTSSTHASFLSSSSFFCGSSFPALLCCLFIAIAKRRKKCGLDYDWGGSSKNRKRLLCDDGE